MVTVPGVFSDKAITDIDFTDGVVDQLPAVARGVSEANSSFRVKEHTTEKDF